MPLINFIYTFVAAAARTVDENEAIWQGRKRMKRMKLDDHNEVYFENDRLNQRLSRSQDFITKAITDCTCRDIWK